MASHPHERKHPQIFSDLCMNILYYFIPFFSYFSQSSKIAPDRLGFVSWLNMIIPFFTHTPHQFYQYFPLLKINSEQPTCPIISHMFIFFLKASQRKITFDIPRFAQCFSSKKYKYWVDICRGWIKLKFPTKIFKREKQFWKGWIKL